jgi:hypothetical protein
VGERQDDEDDVDDNECQQAGHRAPRAQSEPAPQPDNNLTTDGSAPSTC